MSTHGYLNRKRFRINCNIKILNLFLNSDFSEPYILNHSDAYKYFFFKPILSASNLFLCDGGGGGGQFDWILKFLLTHSLNFKTLVLRCRLTFKTKITV